MPKCQNLNCHYVVVGSFPERCLRKHPVRHACIKTTRHVFRVPSVKAQLRDIPLWFSIIQSSRTLSICGIFNRCRSWVGLRGKGLRRRRALHLCHIINRRGMFTAGNSNQRADPLLQKIGKSRLLLPQSRHQRQRGEYLGVSITGSVKDALGGVQSHLKYSFTDFS